MHVNAEPSSIMDMIMIMMSRAYYIHVKWIHTKIQYQGPAYISRSFAGYPLFVGDWSPLDLSFMAAIEGSQGPAEPYLADMLRLTLADIFER
jgi:hypothetical protein